MNPELCSCPQQKVFCFRKVDIITKQGLAGAGFLLRDPEGIEIRTVSGAEGLACFLILPHTVYLLQETAAAPGYLLQRQPYSIMMDCCGRLMVNGTATPQLTVTSSPRSSGLTLVPGGLQSISLPS